MNTLQHIMNKPFIKIGFLLGISFVLAQYLFYFGGRSVVLDETFGNAIQLLLIIGLYLGLHHCLSITPKASFWKLLLWGLGIIVIAVSIRIIFSVLLYNFLAPEIGTYYTETLVQQMTTTMEGLPNIPKEQYTEMMKILLNPMTIPLFEGISLGSLGAIFALFIAGVMNMFRK
ncbi:MAG: DUF4199 domain-containing protein [Flavobacteriaceae bacterium]|nr:DUF4199 domain-containing protein [Flavobacteriaceae bacterium]